jgi:hypothetical protein
MWRPPLLYCRSMLPGANATARMRRVQDELCLSRAGSDNKRLFNAAKAWSAHSCSTQRTPRVASRANITPPSGMHLGVRHRTFRPQFLGCYHIKLRPQLRIRPIPSLSEFTNRLPAFISIYRTAAVHYNSLTTACTIKRFVFQQLTFRSTFCTHHGGPCICLVQYIPTKGGTHMEVKLWRNNRSVLINIQIFWDVT